MFEVEWFGAAMDAVDEVLVSLDEQAQLRFVGILDELNGRLARSPVDEGESRGGAFRLTFVELLAVYFWVDDANAVVRVTAARRYGR